MKNPSSRVQVQAFAKINLFLEVNGRRRDGYHLLDTLFDEISLSDDLILALAPTEEIRLKVSGAPGLPVDGRNLVYRAASQVQDLLKSQGKNSFGFTITLRKKIPLGAGWGGGSSDAAATLRGSAALAGVSVSGLSAKARRLGADVPFFLVGGLARGRGIGDRLTPLSATPPRYYVLVYPRVHIATASVYAALRFPLTKKHSGHRLQKELMAGHPAALWSRHLFNRLEEVVCPRYSPVREARRALSQAGCRAVLMSGSGSSVFGVVEGPAQGRRVVQALAGTPWDRWLVHSVRKDHNHEVRHGDHRDSRHPPG